MAMTQVQVSKNEFSYKGKPTVITTIVTAEGKIRLKLKHGDNDDTKVAEFLIDEFLKNDYAN